MSEYIVDIEITRKEYRSIHVEFADDETDAIMKAYDAFDAQQPDQDGVLEVGVTGVTELTV